MQLLAPATFNPQCTENVKQSMKQSYEIMYVKKVNVLSVVGLWTVTCVQFHSTVAFKQQQHTTKWR